MQEAITIFAEGSATLGFGHVRRSITLAHELASTAAVKLCLIGAGDAAEVPADVQAHLRNLHWHHHTALPPFEGKLRILDMEPPSQRAALMAPAPWTATLALDWFDPTILPTVTINLIDHSHLMAKAYAAAGRSSDYHEGPEYAIIRPSLLALKDSRRLPTPSTVRKLLITQGGADPAHRSIEALEMLHRHSVAGMEITLIVGPLVPGDYEKQIRAASPPGVQILRNPPDFDSHLAAADLVVCSGGGTLLEALALGKPAVVLPQTGAESSHARSHVEAGACVLANEFGRVLADADLRQKLAQNAIQRVDGRGVNRIAATAMKCLSKT